MWETYPTVSVKHVLLAVQQYSIQPSKRGAANIVGAWGGTVYSVEDHYLFSIHYADSGPR